MTAAQERLDMRSGYHAAKILPVDVRGTKNVWGLSSLLENLHLMPLFTLLSDLITASATLESISPVGVPGKALIGLNEQPSAWPFCSSGFSTIHQTTLILPNKAPPKGIQVWNFSLSFSEHCAAKQNHQ